MVTDSFSLACPNCGSVNTLTSSSTPKEIDIRCSSCRASLGRWDRLMAQAGTQALRSRSQLNGAQKAD